MTEQVKTECLVGLHIEPYLKVDNYYCSACHKGMGNAYYHMRQRLEQQIEALRTALINVVDINKEEDEYRWEKIGKWPHDTKIPDQVRAQWVEDLAKISAKQKEVKASAEALLVR